MEQYRKHCPDVTLMDLQMPGMGGLEALHIILQEDTDARIVVLNECIDDHRRCAFVRTYEGVILDASATYVEIHSHGAITDRSGVIAQRDLILAVRDKVAPLVARGLATQFTPQSPEFSPGCIKAGLAHVHRAIWPTSRHCLSPPLRHLPP